ncbi:ArsA family ATPase [Anaerosporobacter faecicola]|uniref:ArsA family ATPase n=1 Tax=Anaerosporobacter faecicola TaxID=2718714 RepID=UPI00143B5E45|nr:ArsA family ATPase [Anaerosporobacter faecicola]
MKRILIFTGKGGVGKTSVAAAHALRSAMEGKKTILVSTDMAHNLGDLFEKKIGHEEVKITDQLYALEVDPDYVCMNEFKSMMEAFQKFIESIGKDDQEIDSFTMIPGIDELFSLLKIQQLYEKSDYERIIVDCAPTGETLALLKFPELLCWYMDKFFPVEKIAMRVLSPVSKRLFQIQLPDGKAMSEIEKLYMELIKLQELLKNKEVSSIRLVTIPEKMIVEETKRNYMYMNLYNYNVDGIFINRVLPAEIDNPFFTDWLQIQRRYIDEIQTSFGQIPLYTIPWYDTDLLGLDSVKRICEDGLASSEDLFKVQSNLEGETYEQTENGYQLKLYLPYIEKDQVDVHLSGSDVILKIGNYKRNIPLPNVLRGLEVTYARFEDNRLCIQFEKE